MRQVLTAISLLALFSLISTPLWAGSTHSVRVSCVIEPRITAQLTTQPAITEEANTNLVQQKEQRPIATFAGYNSAIIYSYCAR